MAPQDPTRPRLTADFKVRLEWRHAPAEAIAQRLADDLTSAGVEVVIAQMAEHVDDTTADLLVIEQTEEAPDHH